MTTTSVFAYALCIAAIALEALTAFSVFRNGRRWKSLTAYLTAKCAWSCALMGLAAGEWFYCYFYLYWVGRGLLILIEMRLLVAFFSRITCGLNLFPDVSKRVLVVAAAAFCLLGAVVAAAQPIHQALPITRIVLYGERSVQTVEACILISIFVAARLAPGRVDVGIRGVGIGLSIQVAAQLAVFALLPIFPQYGSLLSNAAEVLDIVVLGAWLLAFRKPIPEPVLVEATPQVLSNLRRRALGLQADLANSTGKLVR